MLEVRLLGKFEVNRDGKTIAIPSRPSQSLFAYLILHAWRKELDELTLKKFWEKGKEMSLDQAISFALGKN